MSHATLAEAIPYAVMNTDTKGALDLRGYPGLCLCFDRMILPAPALAGLVSMIFNP